MKVFADAVIKVLPKILGRTSRQFLPNWAVRNLSANTSFGRVGIELTKSTIGAVPQYAISQGLFQLTKKPKYSNVKKMTMPYGYYPRRRSYSRYGRRAYSPYRRRRTYRRF